MTPAEKAIELVDKYVPQVGGWLSTSKQIENAKQCALLAVGEILATSASEYEHEDNFWRSVKDEILKL